MGARRLIVLGVLLAPACGRLDFAPRPDSGATGTADASVDTPPACTGHDEDGDGVPDPCDNCPSIANPAQENRGELDAAAAADAVGDACDPRPALAGDRIALFLSFETDLPAGFTTNGTVTWDDTNVLHLGVAGGIGQVPFTSTARFTRAELHFRITSYGTGVTYAGLWTHIDGDLNDAVFPQISDNAGTGGPTEFFIKEAMQGTDRYSPTVLMARELAPGDDLVTLQDTALATGGPERYTIEVLATGDRLVTELTGVTRSLTGAYELEAVNVGMDVTSLVLYDGP